MKCFISIVVVIICVFDVGCSTTGTTQMIHYTIQGNIIDPGVKTAPMGTTLIGAIAEAKQSTFGRSKYVSVKRDEKTMEICIRDIIKHPENDVKLQDGDVINCLQADYIPSNNIGIVE